MERKGEARRGTAMAFNGRASKRRPRSGRLRDSPEDEGGVKMAEKKMRLPDEVMNKRDSERSSHGKKRDGAESSEKSLGEEEEYEEEEEEEEDDYDISIRRHPYSESYKIHPQKQRNSLSDKIYVPVPRKARSVSKKRMSNEWLESVHIKNSGRKKMKAMNGSKQQKPPPKISKQPSFIEDELEVAEFLFGLTRHFNQENNDKNEPKPHENSNPNSNPASSPNIALKKKRPAVLKSKEENRASLASTSMVERDESEKNSDPSVRNGQMESLREAERREGLINGSKVRMEESREQHFFPFSLNPDRNNRDQSAAKTDVPAESAREQKFGINLMQGKLSTERGDGLEKKARGPEIETVPKSSSEKRDNEKAAQTLTPDLLCKERFLNLEFDSEKSENHAAVGSRNRAPQPELPKAANSKAECKQDKDKAGPSASLPMPMAMGGWPGNLPPIGFMGQFPLPLPPGLLPISGNPTSSNNLQARGPRGPPLHRPKRCLTHCYLAKLIDYHQKLLKMNPFAAGPPAGVPRLPPFNLGLVPPSSDPSILQMQGNFTSNHSENKPSCSTNNNISENQRKQMPQSGQMADMMHGPAFMFPINQQQAAAAMAAAMAVTANRPNTSASPNTSSPSGSLPPRPMNLTMPGLPTVDPQILTALKNGTYPFPVPGPTGMPQSYRGGPQSMPWPFFPHQMLPHQQLRPNVGPQQSPIQKTSASSQRIQEIPFGENRIRNQVKLQDGDKDKRSNNNNNNNSFSQVQNNVYDQNYTIPFAFNAPRPAIMRHPEKTEEYKQKAHNTLNGKGGEKNQSAMSASGKLQTVNNNLNKPSAATSSVAPLQQQMLIQLQKQQQQLMQEHQLLTSRPKNVPPGGERISNNASDFSQVIKTAFPHAIIKRMESKSPSTSTNNNNNHYINPQNRTILAGTNVLKTVQSGSKQPVGPTAASPSTSISKSSNSNNNNNNNTGGSPPNSTTSKAGSLTKTPLTPPHQSLAKNTSPSIRKNPNNLSPQTPYPNPNSIGKPNQSNHNQNSISKDPKQQVYPRPQFFYANPQQIQPYASSTQKHQQDNPVPAGPTVYRMPGPGVGPTQPMTGGTHARVPVSFAYLPMVAPVPVSNKVASDQKQANGK